MEPLIQSKKLGRPCVHISFQFAFCSFASTRLYLHFWKIQLIWKTQPTDGTRPLRKEQGYKYYLSLYIYYFNVCNALSDRGFLKEPSISVGLIMT